MSFPRDFLHGLREGPFAALDTIPDFRKIAAFEDGLGKPKPLLGGALSSFAALKCLQHGEVGRYFRMLNALSAGHQLFLGRIFAPYRKLGWSNKPFLSLSQ